MGKIAEFFMLILGLILSVFELKTSGVDYHSHTIEEQTAFIRENEEAFNSFIEIACENVGDHNSHGSLALTTVQREYGLDLSVLRTRIKDRVSINSIGDNILINFDLTGPPAGYGNAALVYFIRRGDTPFPMCDEVVTEDGVTKYITYHSANSSETIQIDEHWYFSQTAFYDSENFRRKEG